MVPSSLQEKVVAEASPQFAGYLFDRASERSQTATHIFGLALAMWRALAPRIQYQQEGPWISI